MDVAPAAQTSFTGSGFGTVQHAVEGPRRPPPAAVSGRALMRRALPAIYQEDDFTMRFVGAFEEVLDPIAAVLDGLPAHILADHAPQPLLHLVAAWLGLTIDESQPLVHQRDAVRAGGELARRRGTTRGIALMLGLTFPELVFRIEDEGGVWWSTTGAPASGVGRRFVVHVEAPAGPDRLAAIARCIDREKPAGTSYRLLVTTTGGPTS